MRSTYAMRTVYFCRVNHAMDYFISKFIVTTKWNKLHNTFIIIIILGLSGVPHDRGILFEIFYDIQFRVVTIYAARIVKGIHIRKHRRQTLFGERLGEHQRANKKAWMQYGAITTTIYFISIKLKRWHLESAEVDAHPHSFNPSFIRRMVLNYASLSLSSAHH